MNNILIVDDRQDYINDFKTIAGAKGMNVATAKSFEGLKEQMPKLHNKIAVVILDIKCLIHDAQEVENEDFIGTAITFLDQNYPKFPRIILTGDDESFSGFQRFNKNEEVFLKGAEDKLFERIQWYCDNSEILQIKRTYPDIFEMFAQGLMDSTQETNLINILKKIDEKNPLEFKGIIANIRSLQETIYKSINQKNKIMVPDTMFQPNGMIKWNPLMNHLIGNPIGNSRIPVNGSYKNQTIFNFADCLYWSCGQYIHTVPPGGYMISQYALKSLIYNLLELLIWAKPYLK